MTATEPTSDRAALTKAICAHPEEDTPRLAFADWLDEQGEREDRAQAAFIRAAITLHNRTVPVCEKIGDGVDRDGLYEPAPRCRCRWCRVARPAWKASRSHKTTWINRVSEPIDDARFAAEYPPRDEPLVVLESYPWERYWFQRGFVEGVGISAREFMTHAGELFTRAPFTDVQWVTHEPAQVPGGSAWDARYPEGTHMWRDFGPWSPAAVFSMNNVPSEVFDLLPDAVVPDGDPHLKLYPSEGRARASLNKACLAFGRRERDRIWAREAQPTV